MDYRNNARQFIGKYLEEAKYATESKHFFACIAEIFKSVDYEVQRGFIDRNSISFGLLANFRPWVWPDAIRRCLRNFRETEDKTRSQLPYLYNLEFDLSHMDKGTLCTYIARTSRLLPPHPDLEDVAQCLRDKKFPALATVFEAAARSEIRPRYPVISFAFDWPHPAA